MNNLSSDRPAMNLKNIKKAIENASYRGDQRNNSDAEQNAVALLKHWRKNRLTVFYVEHCSLNPTSLFNETNEGNDFKDLVKRFSGESFIKKKVYMQNFRQPGFLNFRK